MARQPLVVQSLTAETALEELYHRTRDARLRTRAQMILLATEQQLVASEIAVLVRQGEQTVRNWIKRFKTSKALRTSHAPAPQSKGRTSTASGRGHVVRRRPRALGQPYSRWSLQRLANFMAEETGLRLSYEGVGLTLKAQAIVLSPPQHKITSPDPEYEVKKKRSRRSAPP